MRDQNHHSEWLRLIEISGPFLAEPVLRKVFPQGLEQIDCDKRRLIRQAYDEWRQAIDQDDPQSPALHKAWVDLVLKRGLELDENEEEDILKPREKLPDTLSNAIPEHGITLRPDYAVIDEQNDDRPLLLVQLYPPDTGLEKPVKGDGWASSPAERMVALCRANNVRLGLVTNGEQWMLVDAPVGAVTTFASWYARLWGQEPLSLQAFVNFLRRQRFFDDPSDQLPALFDESLEHQDEVTDTLGLQVRRAIEVLIQRLDRADVDLNRELLNDVEPSELYEAALTVMMRIVFLLSAEERGLLLLGDEQYEANYAVSTLRLQLRTESEEILERRQDAWSRLLSIFRAVYGGIQHESMHLPALGGSLFDPDRFPFLEGRAKASSWRTDSAKPLPIDNRTVLLLLEAVQLFQGRALSYRALNVEQIGYVYEGLLEQTVSRAKEVTLDFDAAKKTKNPRVTLNELEDAAKEKGKALSTLLIERTGRTDSQVKKKMAREVDKFDADKLLTVCNGDQELRKRIKPYFYFLRMDRWGLPLVYPEKTFMVTAGSDRRETGTHYTPKSLTEEIVKDTLEPVTYLGAAEGKSRKEWVLKTPAELLDLKICDPAMGSGAFLVQSCRWLSERLVEAWDDAEKQGNAVTSEGVVVEKLHGFEPLQDNEDEKLLTARRLIAERCLFGVDINPLAVELAKLSIWLVTLAKGRPFGFLDHNLRSGDSLLGIHNLLQLHYLNMNPGKHSPQKLFAQEIDRPVEKAIKLRTELRSRPIRDIRDVEVMARLDDEAKHVLEFPELIADAFVGEVLAASDGKVETAPSTIEVETALNKDRARSRASLKKRAHACLGTDLPLGKSLRRPFHWPLEFPEVFSKAEPGFDALIGNPPFLGGAKISGVTGKCYREYLVNVVASGARGSTTDLVCYFFLRAYLLIRENGVFGLLATNTISEGDTRQNGLEKLLKSGAEIYCASPGEQWPGKAAVRISRVHLSKGLWKGQKSLSRITVKHISSFLSDQFQDTPKPLFENKKKSFQGSNFDAKFVLKCDERCSILQIDEKYNEVIFPFLSGKDLTTHYLQKPSGFVANFWDWEKEKAKMYEVLYEVIKERFMSKKGKLPEKWWRHEGIRFALYHAIGQGKYFANHPDDWKHRIPLDEVIATTVVSKYAAPLIIPNNTLFSKNIVVIASSDRDLFAVLSSSFHNQWVLEMGSRLELRPIYTTTDCFETFPFPVNFSFLAEVGRKLDNEQKKIMKEEKIGLTKLYNYFHNPNLDKNSQLFVKIQMLRRIHEKLDVEVAAAYGWNDLDLEHNFFNIKVLPKKDRVRYTIPEETRIEVLRRLSNLNKSRFDAEKAKLKPCGSTAKRIKIRKLTNSGDLFADNGEQQ